MGFKLKDFSQMIGIDKESSTYDTPVFKKELKSGGPREHQIAIGTVPSLVSLVS